MKALLLWVPFRTYMPACVPLLRQVLADGAGEITELIPDATCLAAQKAAIAAAGLIFVDQSFLNALHGLPPSDVYQPEQPVARGVAEELFDAVLSSSALRVLGLTCNDLHWLDVPGSLNFVASDLSGLAKNFHALVWSFEQWSEVIDGRLPLRHEDWMDTCGSPQANWKALASVIPARFDCPFALSEDEFRQAPARKFWDVSIIGAHYSTRAEALESAKAAGLKIAPYRRVHNVTYKLIQCRKRLQSSKGNWEQRWRRRSMDFVAGRSAVNFACGGGVRYFVRKIPEFAALGCCVAAWPPAGLKHYGFEDGKNIAVCPEPANFGEVARGLLPRKAAREALGRAARELVLAKHTVGVRAAQLTAWLRELSRGRLVRGAFHEGEFQITPA